ncbi:MAG: PadR family transcriptional regulator [Gammaproteobacteria bacterium]|nr:PadR family transcriptional regulator [Gammaproteobacteria bacterium]
MTIAYIQRREPCTPYEIRRSFEKSTTTRFSSSAGSIYPLIKRLHERDLLEMVDTLSDGRGTQQYSVTPKGRSMVRDWITGLGDPGMIGVYDPIGSRLLNLSLLPKDEQIEWLRKTIDLVKRQETVVRDYEEQEFVGDARLYEILRSTRRKESKLRQGMLQLALVALQEN